MSMLSSRLPPLVPPRRPPGPLGATEWSVKLGALGEVVEGLDELEQAIRIILGTPRGSVPHRPRFGFDGWRWLAAPIDQARVAIARDVVDAVAVGEPRVEVTRVEVERDDRAAMLRLRVWWRPRELGATTARPVLGAAPRVLDLPLSALVGAAE